MLNEKCTQESFKIQKKRQNDYDLWMKQRKFQVILTLDVWFGSLKFFDTEYPEPI